MATINTYCTVEQVTTFADSRGETRWTPLSADQRDLIVSYASDDIEAFHKQDRQAYNVPAMYGNVWLREACKHQSLFVMRTLGLREWSERATLATSKNFSDGIITRESGPGEKMDPTAIILIKKGLKEGGRGGNPNLAVFGRG